MKISRILAIRPDPGRAIGRIRRRIAIRQSCKEPTFMNVQKFPQPSAIRFPSVISYCKKAVKRLAIEEDGPTAVEYAVMLALIVGVAIGAIQTLSLATSGSFDASANAIDGAFTP